MTIAAVGRTSSAGAARQVAPRGRRVSNWSDKWRRKQVSQSRDRLPVDNNNMADKRKPIHQPITLGEPCPADVCICTWFAREKQEIFNPPCK